MFQAWNQSLNWGWRVVIKSHLLFCTKWVFWEWEVTVAGGPLVMFYENEHQKKMKTATHLAQIWCFELYFPCLCVIYPFILYFCRPHRGARNVQIKCFPSFISTSHFVCFNSTCLTPVLSPCRNVRLQSFASCLPMYVFLFVWVEWKLPTITSVLGNVWIILLLTQWNFTAALLVCLKVGWIITWVCQSFISVSAVNCKARSV